MRIARHVRHSSNLRAELTQALAQVTELQTTLHAIRSGEVDAIVVDGYSRYRVRKSRTAYLPNA